MPEWQVRSSRVNYPKSILGMGTARAKALRWNKLGGSQAVELSNRVSVREAGSGGPQAWRQRVLTRARRDRRGDRSRKKSWEAVSEAWRRTVAMELGATV